MSAHTPDPWSYNAETGLVVAKDGTEVAYVLQSVPECKANGDLIASSADAIALLRWLDRRGGLGLDVHDRIGRILAWSEGKAP